MKIQYTPPILTVVDFKAERGYAFSALHIDDAAERLNQEMMQLVLENNGSSTSTTETFQYQTGWSQSDGDGFWTTGSGGYF